MDPNAALSEIEDLIASWDTCDPDEEYGIAVQLVDVVGGLHGWLSNGGFLPEAWADARPMTERPSRFIYTGPGGER